LKKQQSLFQEIEIPAEVLARESTIEAAQLGLELIENLQQMAVADDMVEATEVVQEKVGCSEVVALEAPQGNTDSLHTTVEHTTAEIVIIESSTSSDTRSNPSSLSTSSSTSFDMDDIPLNRVYTTLNKRLSLSPSTKTQKKPNYDTLFPCILLLKKGYMTCNKEGLMLAKIYLLITHYNHL